MPCIDYEEARKRYTPSSVNILFVAEAPPSARERYFYFPEVPEHDHLWIALMKALYPQKFGETRQERQRKHDWLTKFQMDGYMLIDACKEPIPKDSSGESKRRSLLRGQSDDLVAEIRRIDPRQVLLIKVTVYDALYEPLKEAGLPVVNERLKFPSSGQQRKFQVCFKELINEARIILSG